MILEWLKDWLLEISRQVVGMSVFYAMPMMVVVGALDSSLLSLPEVNDYITIARVANNPNEVYYFPFFPAIGSLIGCLLLYRIARRGEQFVTRRFHPAHLHRVQELYRKWGVFALVIPALLPPPMPFKIFVATAGVMNYPIGRFALVILIARMIRYYFWGILAYFFQNRVRMVLFWMETHILEIVAVMLGAILLFFIIRWLVIRMRGTSAKQNAQVSLAD